MFVIFVVKLNEMNEDTEINLYNLNKYNKPKDYTLLKGATLFIIGLTIGLFIPLFIELNKPKPKLPTKVCNDKTILKLAIVQGLNDSNQWVTLDTLQYIP